MDQNYSGEIPLHDLRIHPTRLSDIMSSDGNEDEDYRDDDNAQTGLLNGKAKPYTPHKPTFAPSDDGPPSKKASLMSKIFMTVGLLALCVAVVLLGKAANMMETEIAAYCTSAGGKEPEYFQHTKSDFRGPTATGRPPMLAQQDAGLQTDGRAGSLELNELIEGGNGKDGGNGSIFRKMGSLSPWYMDESGFGVDEHVLPPGSDIVQAFILHRHGARYPTTNSSVVSLGKNISTTIAQSSTGFKDKLSFLNSWSYGLGANVLVPYGRQQLFESGVAAYYSYGALYDNATKIVARTTTQDRMVESAENFLAGFFGLRWERNATLETIIEWHHGNWNNSLAGYDNCPNSNNKKLHYGGKVARQWKGLYLQNATERLQAMSPSSFTWTASKAWSAQALCPYETVAFGYSNYCSLFTASEWDGFEYSQDLEFSGDTMFQSPTGRAIGVGWVQELLARLDQHLIVEPTAQDNITLDNNTRTFPLNQSLYLDFTHDSMITAILAALSIRQFAPTLPADGPPDPDRAMILSKVVPFAARLAIEIIKTPKPVKASRNNADAQYETGPEMKYVHFLLNSRTLPLGKSMPECGDRDDGWCDLQTFLDVQRKSLEKAQYEYSCFGEYTAGKYGDVVDGVPVG